MHPPSRLFKYYPATFQAVENLKNHGLWFGSPLAFNDPFDCRILPRIAALSAGDISRLRGELLGRIPPEEREALTSLGDRDLGAQIVASAQRALLTKSEEFGRLRGVACFSATNDNLLMWSHYAQQHQGFVLEFDTSKEPFSKVFAVRYEDRAPSVSAGDLLLEEAPAALGNDPVFRALYGTKAECWAYEKEWRVPHAEKDTLYIFPGESLVNVYFGAMSRASLREIICLVLQSQNPNVGFWQAEQAVSEFRLHFRKFTYTPRGGLC